MSGRGIASAPMRVDAGAVARLERMAAARRGAARGPGRLRVLDRFDDLGAWKAAASDGVTAALSAAQGVAGPALRLDFDLGGTAGYAAAARALPLDLPPNYEISVLRCAPTRRRTNSRSSSSTQAATTSGGSIAANFEFPRQWQRIRIRKRQIEFAWGPITGRELHTRQRIEFVVAAGRGGGAARSI